MRLILCEKPSQAREYARLLGGARNGDGCIQTAQGTLTWAIGHLLEQVMPEVYDARYKAWRVEDLPIVPERWKLAPRTSVAAQYRKVAALIKQADEVVIATDAGREGELIARELLERSRYRGPIKRLWASALDDTSLRKAWANLRDGSATLGLYQAALARQRCDWLVGINLTRAATRLLAPRDTLFSVGRVQTPILAMIVRRDREIADFKPQDYFELAAVVACEKGPVTLFYAPPEGKRLYRREEAEALAARLCGGEGPLRVVSERKHRAPPRPFALSDLQGEANRRFGLSAARTLELAQQLYERHKAISYPRSDCTYLPEEQIGAERTILDRLHAAGHLPMAITTPKIRKGTVFNSAKLSDHHAIIPTAEVPKALAGDEFKVYRLIAERYAMQFLPDYRYEATSITLALQVTLSASGQVPLEMGWRTLQGVDEEEAGRPLPPIVDGTPGRVETVTVEAKRTRPPNPYSERSLLGDIKNIQKYVTEAELKARLRESSGIGTEATRAAIIETLKQRGYIRVEGRRKLVATPLGCALIDALPEKLYDPGVTALWEDQLEEVVEGRRSEAQVVASIAEQLRADLELLRGRATGQPRPVGGPDAPTGRRRASPKRGGRGAQPRSTPHEVPAPASTPDAPCCPRCAKPMVSRHSSRGPFWGCADFPRCRGTRAMDPPGARGGG